MLTKGNYVFIHTGTSALSRVAYSHAFFMLILIINIKRKDYKETMGFLKRKDYKETMGFLKRKDYKETMGFLKRKDYKETMGFLNLFMDHSQANRKIASIQLHHSPRVI